MITALQYLATGLIAFGLLMLVARVVVKRMLARADRDRIINIRLGLIPRDDTQ